MRLLQACRGFLFAEDGPAAVEYAIMLAIIIVACIGSVGHLGVMVNVVCDTVCHALGRG